MKWRTAGSLALAALLAAMPGCIQTEPDPPAPGQIDGAVVDETANGMGDVTVKLVQLGLEDPTSRLGGFTFRSIPPGTYTLTASAPDRLSDEEVVVVESGEVVKIILQLMPPPEPESSLETHHKPVYVPLALPGTECDLCAWKVPYEEAPMEVDLEATWDAYGPQGDLLRFEVWNETELIYDGEQSTPFTSLSFGRSHLGSDAGELRIRVFFEQGFTPRPNFELDMVWTFYYGATHSEFFAS